MNDYLGEALKAIGVLLSAGLVVLAYMGAKHFASDNDKNLFTSLLVGAAVCGVFGFINASNVGRPTCLDSETDNRGSTCNEYADDGFEATSEQRVSAFIYSFTVAIVPISFGVRSGINSRDEKIKKE